VSSRQDLNQRRVRLDPVANARHDRDRRPKIGIKAGADRGDDRGAERAEFLGACEFERQFESRGENLEPGAAPRRPAGKSGRARPGASLQEMIDVAAMLDSGREL